MSLSRIIQTLAFSAVCLTGLAAAAPSEAASAMRPQVTIEHAQPPVTLAHWEYRHHRRYWVEDRGHYRRYDHRYEGRY